MSDIFISYKREDQAIARKLANALEREGWSVWWDPRLRAGERFDDVIEKALNEAKSALVMWSNLSVNSTYVKDEATYALSRRKLVPVAIEKVNPPFRFEGLHTRSLCDWDGSDDFPEFKQLVDDITAMIGESAAHKTRTAKPQLSEQLERISDITVSQSRGHGDNTQSTYSTPDSWLVVIRDLILVNRSERDEVVSLKLWLPLNNSGLVFSPQTSLPPNIDIGQVSLLRGVENIPARNSATGSVLFKIPRCTVPRIAVPFFIIIVTSQLTGIERAFNSLDFAEVTKPYPRTLEELNQQLASSKH